MPHRNRRSFRREFLKLVGLATAARGVTERQTRSGDGPHDGANEGTADGAGIHADRSYRLTVRDASGRRFVRPTAVVARRGETIGLRISNPGPASRRVTIDAYGVAVAVGPEGTTTESVPVHGAGAFPIDCPESRGPAAGQVIVMPTVEAQLPRVRGRTLQFVADERVRSVRAGSLAAAVEGELVTLELVATVRSAELIADALDVELAAGPGETDAVTVEADSPGIFPVAVEAGSERVERQLLVLPRRTDFSRIEAAGHRRFTLPVGEFPAGTVALAAKRGEAVGLALRNGGESSRRVAVPALDERCAVGPGERRTIEVTPEEDGIVDVTAATRRRPLARIVVVP